jgi:SSS family solute:Na+ symporter
MDQRLIILLAYFLVNLIIGFSVRRKAINSPSQYFLAGRGLGTFLMVCTMAATNFSAFTVFGTSGAGYRDGLSMFPIMAFGTGFMAITFWLLGKKVHQLGKESGVITPPELMWIIYRHKGLRILFALVMIVFTIPYLAIQPMAGGLVLKELFHISQFAGASIIVLVITIYTFRGGLRAIAWADVFQGILMLVMMIVAVVVVGSHFGGLTEAIKKAYQSNPELFSRPGGTMKYLPGIWFSYMMLWFFCDPMFPQIFQKFFSSDTARPLAKTALLYPLICTVVFICPVLLGVMGRLVYPSLQGLESDNIVPLVVVKLGGDLLGTLVLTAGLAALMSTLDAQLLTLSSIFTHDILGSQVKKSKNPVLIARGMVVLLAVMGLAMSIKPPATILEIAVQAFTGFAVLFPTVLFGLFLKKPNSISAIVSIVAGEIFVVLFALKVLNPLWFLPCVWVIGVSFAAYMISQLILKGDIFPVVSKSNRNYIIGFGIIFILAMDFYRWGKVGTFFIGLPLWVWFFILLSAIQTLLMYFWIRDSLKETN